MPSIRRVVWPEPSSLVQTSAFTAFTGNNRPGLEAQSKDTSNLTEARAEVGAQQDHLKISPTIRPRACPESLCSGDVSEKVQRQDSFVLETK
jgi:hypothetical protein